MPDLTPQNNYPIPSEFEEPYFATAKSFFLAADMADWALAENHNAIWSGGGTFSWTASSGVLTWSLPVEIRTKTTVWKVIVQGPPLPGGQVTLQNGETSFFTHPRLLTQDRVVGLTINSLSQSPGVRLHDIALFATRIGDTVFFADGKSLKDGESGEIFGAGLGTTVQPHEHQPAKVIEPAFSGETVLDLNIASFAPAILKRLRLFRNGLLQKDPDDYSVDTVLGLVTLVVPTTRPNFTDPTPERFVALMETTPPVITTGEHQHMAPRTVTLSAGDFEVDMLVTSLDYPALQHVELHRNGAVQSEPDDYTLDLPSGLVTLNLTAVDGEVITAYREVQF